MKILTSLLKVGFSGGALYVLIDQGLFSSNQKETIEASKKIFDTVPGLENYSEKIGIGMTKEDIINYWNSGVKSTISALADLPSNSKEAFGKGVSYIQKELKDKMKENSS